MSVDFNKIKMIIWGLDDTFWDGTLGEGSVNFIKTNIELVKTSTDCGIINSICSKNDYNIATSEIAKTGILDYFVAPSIDWTNKGMRVQQLISDLQLRDANVLFIDDNITNINEVKYYNNNIMTIMPTDISSLYNFVSKLSPKDLNHNRLKQYKIIEKKLQKKSESSSNIEFLRSCNIKVEIKNNCLSVIDRIHEILSRTNQLNYTKNRSTIEEIKADIENPENVCSYVEVSDDYGDYGIVGFFCLQRNRLKHFSFSCRCMGMGIEQYVFSHLNYPEIEVVGDVTVPLNYNESPDWINNDETIITTGGKSEISNDIKVLLKGPCDMSQVFSFIKENENIDCEFTYVSSKGVSIEQHNHTQCILQSLNITPGQKQQIIDELPFGDEKMYDSEIFSDEYSIVFFSVLSDCGMGVYRRKTGEYIAFGEYVHPLTAESEWDDYVNKKTATSNCDFDYASLKQIQDNYEYVGRLSTDQIMDNLKSIFAKLNEKCQFVLLFG